MDRMIFVWDCATGSSGDWRILRLAQDERVIGATRLPRCPAMTGGTAAHVSKVGMRERIRMEKPRDGHVTRPVHPKWLSSVTLERLYGVTSTYIWAIFWPSW